MTRLVASSIAPRSVAKGRSSPNQRWRLPSTCRSWPSRSARSRRLRCRGARWGRGDGWPASSRMRRRVRAGMLMRSWRSSSSARCARLAPAYFPAASPVTRSRSSASVRLTGSRPPVAVDQSGGPVLQPRCQESAGLADRQAQYDGRPFQVDRPVAHVPEDVGAAEDTRVIEGVIGGSFHGSDRDKVAGRLPRTESLAVHTR